MSVLLKRKSQISLKIQRHFEWKSMRSGNILHASSVQERLSCLNLVKPLDLSMSEKTKRKDDSVSFQIRESGREVIT